MGKIRGMTGRIRELSLCYLQSTRYLDRSRAQGLRKLGPCLFYVQDFGLRFVSVAWFCIESKR